MNVGDIVESLQSFGLEAKEALVYYHLARRGASKAQEVASDAGIARTEAYRDLEALEKKGFVQRTIEKPARFVATPLEQALQPYLKRRSAELAELAGRQQLLQRVWPKGPEREDVKKARIAVHQGRHQMEAYLQRMVESTREDLWLVMPPRTLARFGVLDAVARRLKAAPDVRVRLLTKVGPEIQGPLAELRGNVEIRHADLPAYVNLVISDHDELCVLVNPDGSLGGAAAEDALLSATSPVLALAQKSLVDALWTFGTDFETRRAAMAHEIGRPRYELIRGRFIRLQRVRDMLAGLRRELRVAAPGTEYERWEAAGMWERLRKKAAQGAVITLVGAEGFHDRFPEGNFQPARPTQGIATFWADGREGLQVFGVLEEPTSQTCDHEWALWGTGPEFLRGLDLEAPTDRLVVPGTST